MKSWRQDFTVSPCFLLEPLLSLRSRGGPDSCQGPNSLSRYHMSHKYSTNGNENNELKFLSERMTFVIIQQKEVGPFGFE